jgi:hypothetical protein
MIYVIHQPWGGLGDNLQFSSLPEQLSKAGHIVYIHLKNTYRNPEIKELVWDRNPFVSGVADAPVNCGWIGVDPACHRDRFPNVPKFGINKWEMLFGAPLSAGIPKLYFTPPRLPGLENVVLVDLNFSSCTYFQDKVMEVMYREVAARWPGGDVRQVAFMKEGVSHHVYKSAFTTIEVQDIYHYCQLIANCRAVVTLLTGSSPLASAVKGMNPTPDILTIKKSDYHEGQIFPNVEFVDAH